MRPRLLAMATVGLLVAGLGNRPAVVAESEDIEDAIGSSRSTSRQTLRARSSATSRSSNTDRLEEGYFRMCINYDERDRVWCVFVNVEAEPPTVVRGSEQDP